MGPPPDPEHMINMLQDPNFASTLDEALQNPALIDQMIANNPMLQGMGPQVRQAMQNPAIRRMMTDPEMMRQATQMQRQLGGGMFGGGAGEGAFPMPGATDTTPGQAGERTAPGGNAAGTGAGQLNPFDPFAMFGNLGASGQGYQDAAAAENPFRAMFQGIGNSTRLANNTSQPPPGQENSTTNTSANQQSQQQSQQPANPFAAMAQNPMMQNLLQNPQLMQQMMQSMMGSPSQSGDINSDSSNVPNTSQTNPFAALFGPGGMGSLGAGGLGGVGAAPAAPADTRPPEERFQEQLRQLNDMGFCEFDRNVEALRRSGGSVQGAVEYLLTR